MSILSRRAILGSGVAGRPSHRGGSRCGGRHIRQPRSTRRGGGQRHQPEGAHRPGAAGPGPCGQRAGVPLIRRQLDVNGMPQFWTSFDLAPRRIQNGGWARQITQDDFKISTTIAGVNMRLGPGGVRELHWHQQAEWAVMT